MLNFPLPVTISPQRPGHSLGFICNCEVEKDNISFQKTLSPVYTMRSYDDLHDTITDNSMKKMFLAKSFKCGQDLDFVKKEHSH